MIPNATTQNLHATEKIKDPVCFRLEKKKKRVYGGLNLTLGREKGTDSGLLGKLGTVIIVVQSLSRVRLSATPWTAACQPSPSFTISWSLLKLMSIESVMPSNHLILCCPLLLLLSTFPSIRVFPSEAILHIRGPKKRYSDAGLN